jgi:hypothetical protein
MEVEFALRPDDVLAFHRYYLERQPRPGGRQWIWVLVAVPLLAYMWYRYREWNAADYTLPLLVSIWFFAVIVILLVQRGRIRTRILGQLRRQLDDPWHKKLLGWRRLSITPEGITYTAKLTSATARWQAIEQVVVTDEHSFFFTTKTAGFVLPARAFADDEEFREFVKTARRYRKEADAEPEDEAPSRRRRSPAEETGFTSEEPADG